MIKVINNTVKSCDYRIFYCRNLCPPAGRVSLTSTVTEEKTYMTNSSNKTTHQQPIENL